LTTRSSTPYLKFGIYEVNNMKIKRLTFTPESDVIQISSEVLIY